MNVLRLDAGSYAHNRAGLAEILRATVASGGAVGFMDPLGEAEALTFWDRHAARLDAGSLTLFVAMEDGAVAGTVSLDCGLPPNQPHRGDVCKMMVHPRFRRRGIARRMLEAVETEARRRDLSLLVLDTRTGDAAQTLYAAAGFKAVGEIPGYALDPDGASLHGTTVMYRTL